jgi:hypothetical protein
MAEVKYAATPGQLIGERLIQTRSFHALLRRAASHCTAWRR